MGWWLFKLTKSFYRADKYLNLHLWKSQRWAGEPSVRLRLQSPGNRGFKTRMWRVRELFFPGLSTSLPVLTAFLPVDFGITSGPPAWFSRPPNSLPVTRRPSLGVTASSALRPVHPHSLVTLPLPGGGSLAPQDFCTCSLLSVKLTHATICNWWCHY